MQQGGPVGLLAALIRIQKQKSGSVLFLYGQSLLQVFSDVFHHLFKCIKVLNCKKITLRIFHIIILNWFVIIINGIIDIEFSRSFQQFSRAEADILGIDITTVKSKYLYRRFQVKVIILTDIIFLLAECLI